ncbi:hypothetical protein CEXT_494841 [Caerostris extrusa]|uniref:Uncharacterized protein n=1 Tax=Caerostris extrusa TaxID=172846 RepID=A0AAV4NZA7_CAEEX|nr:hypothetical protein CEXT_494841 [Caerostris extrusa]
METLRYVTNISFRSHQLSVEKGARRSCCHFPTSNRVSVHQSANALLQKLNYGQLLLRIVIHRGRNIGIAKDTKTEKLAPLRYLIHGKPANISFRSHQPSVESVDHVATLQLPILSLPIKAKTRPGAPHLALHGV